MEFHERIRRVGWGWRHRRSVPEKARQQGRQAFWVRPEMEGKWDWPLRAGSPDRTSQNPGERPMCPHSVKSGKELPLSDRPAISNPPFSLSLTFLNSLTYAKLTRCSNMNLHTSASLPSLTIHLTAHTKQSLLNTPKEEYLHEYITPWSKHQIIFTFGHI